MTKTVYPSALPYPFAKAVRAGDFVFVSGQIPFGPDGPTSCSFRARFRSVPTA